MARTLYDVLGAPMAASSEELRQAYRNRARELHPDRRLARDGREPDALGGAMRELNEAWRVLRDPAGRAVYDRSLRPSAVTRRSGAFTGAEAEDDLDDDFEDVLDRPFRGRPAEPGDLVVALVRALPWVVIGLVLGGIFVFTAFAGHHGDPASKQVVGDCVRSTSSLEVVLCGPGVQQVRDVTQRTTDCPVDTVGVEVGRNRVLCLRAFTGVSP
jgi:hypothetical protein